MPLAVSLERVSLSVPEKEIRMNEMTRLVEPLHHEKMIIHGDIKLSNVLLCSDGKVWLCDFEEAQKIENAAPPQAQRRSIAPHGV